MSADTDTRDRVIRLETEVEQLTKTVASMDTKVTAMHELLMQAKGARWAIWAAAGIGGAVAAKLSIFLPWFPPK